MNLEAKDKLTKTLKDLRGNGTYTDLGKRLGVSYMAVSNWETGVNFPDRLNLGKIAKLAGYTLDDFVAYLEGNEKPVTELEFMVSKIRQLPLKQLAIVERAVSERLFTIAESAGGR